MPLNGGEECAARFGFSRGVRHPPKIIAALSSLCSVRTPWALITAPNEAQGLSDQGSEHHDPRHLKDDESERVVRPRRRRYHLLRQLTQRQAYVRIRRIRDIAGPPPSRQHSGRLRKSMLKNPINCAHG
jgi:hypothetical protein